MDENTQNDPAGQQHDHYEMVAKTFQGLEDVLRDELISLGAENVEIGCRMVTFTGGLELMYKANLCCRTALRILKPIVKFSASDPDELYDAVRDFEWENLLGPDSTFSIDSTVNSADFPHSKFVTYRVKDGIADRFNDLQGRRPSVRLTGADVCLNVHIIDNRVTISLDSSGEPLSRRGYRMEQTEAPLNEALAAGIILKTGWRGDCNFVDPMCGSGTFLIEAALIAANINPGIFRKNFAFEKWPDFDADLFEELYNDDSAEREPAFAIEGGDIDPEAVAIARRNIHNARLDDVIKISCRPFTDWQDAPEAGILITNPPYGERLKPDDIMDLYRSLGSTLKHQFGGYHAWVLGYRDEHFSAIGLRPSVKFPILNGSLECSIREYVLFDGKYNDFKSEGGSVSNTSFNREAKPKVRRMTDKEWESGTRKFDRKPRRDGEFKPRRDGEFKPRRDGDFKPRRDGEFKPRRDGDFKPRRDGDFKPRRDGDFKPRRDSEFKPRRDGEFKPRREGEFKPRHNNRDTYMSKEDRVKASRTITDKGPKIPESQATVFSPVPIRSRRKWRNATNQTEETNED